MSKYLCLSFDDGPNIIPGDTTMNDMLDIMEKHNVPGSFFLIGNKITEDPGLCNTYRAHGHAHYISPRAGGEKAYLHLR